jgi:hypothetical protein
LEEDISDELPAEAEDMEDTLPEVRFWFVHPAKMNRGTVISKRILFIFTFVLMKEYK